MTKKAQPHFGNPLLIGAIGAGIVLLSIPIVLLTIRIDEIFEKCDIKTGFNLCGMNGFPLGIILSFVLGYILLRMIIKRGAGILIFASASLLVALAMMSDSSGQDFKYILNPLLLAILNGTTWGLLYWLLTNSRKIN